MPSLLPRSSSTKEQKNEEGGGGSMSHLYLNVYDLTPINNYLYWFGLGIFHSGIEERKLIRERQVSKDDNSLPIRGSRHGICPHLGWLENFVYLMPCTNIRQTKAVHGMEYGFGAHDSPTSGVFEVEPKSYPGFVYRFSVSLGTTDMPRAEFRLFIEQLSGKYHGDTYHLIAKNCNHFTDDVCMHLTGKPIPGWVNRLARLGSFCNCLLPESIQVSAVRHLPDHHAFSEDGSVSYASTIEDSDDDGPDHHLLSTSRSNPPYSREKPLKLPRDIP